MPTKKIRIKGPKGALNRLQEKGVDLKVIKEAERPAPVNAAPAKTSAAPTKKKQNAKIDPAKKEWEMKIIRDNYTDYIDKVIIKEI